MGAGTIRTIEAEPANSGTTPEPEVFGWAKRVELLDGKISLETKLDTGALTWSLDATDIERSHFIYPASAE